MAMLAMTSYSATPCMLLQLKFCFDLFLKSHCFEEVHYKTLSVRRGYVLASPKMIFLFSLRRMAKAIREYTSPIPLVSHTVGVQEIWEKMRGLFVNRWF